MVTSISDVASLLEKSGPHLGEDLVAKPLIVCAAAIEGGCGSSGSVTVGRAKVHVGANSRSH